MMTVGLEKMKRRAAEYRLFSVLCAVVGAALWLIPVPLVTRAFLFAAVADVYVCFLAYGHLYSPAGLFIPVFFVQVGCSQAKLTAIEQEDFLPTTWMVVAVVTVTFFAGVAIAGWAYRRREARKAALPCEKTDLSGELLSARTLWIANVVLTVVELAAYTVVFWKLGTIPLFNDEVRAVALPALIGNVGITFLILPQILIVYNVVYAVQHKKYAVLWFDLVYVVMILLLGARNNVFLPTAIAVAFILIAISRDKTQRRRLLLLAVTFVAIVGVLMVAMPFLRTATNANANGSGLDYYESLYASSEDDALDAAFAGVDGVPRIFKSLWVNLSSEMYGFNHMVGVLEETGDYQYGRCFLTGTLNFACKYFMDKPAGDPTELSGLAFVNVITFLHEPYYDFGIFGVAGFTAVYAVGYAWLYHAATRRRRLLTTVYYAYFCAITLMFIHSNSFYYSTFIVNTILLLAAGAVLKVDWIEKFSRKGASK